MTALGDVRISGPGGDFRSGRVEVLVGVEEDGTEQWRKIRARRATIYLDAGAQNEASLDILASSVPEVRAHLDSETLAAFASVLMRRGWKVEPPLAPEAESLG